MMYAGLMIGACYDALRLASHLMQPGMLLQALMDAVFSALVAVILIWAMLNTNYGEMRVFLILGAASGLVLFGFTIHPLLMVAVIRPARWLEKWLRHAGNMTWVKKVFR